MFEEYQVYCQLLHRSDYKRKTTNFSVCTPKQFVNGRPYPKWSPSRTNHLQTITVHKHKPRLARVHFSSYKKASPQILQYGNHRLECVLLSIRHNKTTTWWWYVLYVVRRQQLRGNFELLLLTKGKTDVLGSTRKNEQKHKNQYTMPTRENKKYKDFNNLAIPYHVQSLSLVLTFIFVSRNQK